MESNAHLAALGCGNYNENLGPNSVNKMMLPFSMMRSVQDRGVAVHEATHALQDWNGRPMSQADSECAAYIAHMMYGFLATGGEFPLEVDGQLDMQALAVFQESWTVARRLATERGAYIVRIGSSDPSRRRCARSGPIAGPTASASFTTESDA